MPSIKNPLPDPGDVLLVAFHPAVEAYRDALERVRYLRGRIEVHRVDAEHAHRSTSPLGRRRRDNALDRYLRELAKLPAAEARMWAMAAQVRELPDGEAELERVRASANRAAALRAEARAEQRGER